MEKLLIICGPTATGKTKLAGYLAKEFGGELVSADSRQVYKEMDIGTGKEHIEGVKIWGYDLADPKKEFSVTQFLRFASRQISDIQKSGKLPILVGGTGLYVRALVYGVDTAHVPRNKKLRQELEKRDVHSLYESLSQIDSIKAASLNSSDKKNPRRLIRAIEVAQYNLTYGHLKQTGTNTMLDDNLWIGLTATKKVLDQRIEKRVDDRVKMGIKAEVQKLLKSGVDWHYQSMMSLGYRQWRDYFEGHRPVGPMARRELENRIIEGWKKEERKYAKRQMTWFKKDSQIKWFDIISSDYPKNVENMVHKWYYGKA